MIWTQIPKKVGTSLALTRKSSSKWRIRLRGIKKRPFDNEVMYWQRDHKSYRLKAYELRYGA